MYSINSGAPKTTCSTQQPEDDVDAHQSQQQDHQDASYPSTWDAPAEQLERESHNQRTPVLADPITYSPPPWTLKGDVYMFAFWTTASQAKNLPTEYAYSPLEAQSSFASTESSKPVGGLSMIQILRYNDSPVGPYDELLVVPGSFAWEREDASGRRKKGRNPKITRIYVSQKQTCYNGRISRPNSDTQSLKLSPYGT